MPEPIISTQGLARDYRVGAQTIHALRPLTVEIEAGDFVAIMGPSGSGKSTCMHLLGCLQSPTAGRYRLDGQDVQALAPNALAEVRNTKIGFLFQSFNLLPRATALRNVELPLIYGRIRPRDRHSFAQRALRAVGLGDRMQHRPHQLSGGEMQRVALARAVVNRPRILLADEPTGALDSGTGANILRMFRSLNAEGITIVLVTHDEKVARHARRQIRFLDGKMISDEGGG